MPCYLPLRAHQHVSGKTFKIVQDFRSPTPNVELPCGRCLGCRLEKARSWALRCYHEELTTREDGYRSIFLTLTYAEEHRPHDLVHEHFQKFIRSLRKKTKLKIRYFMCGEYGEKNGREHFHAILFGYRPDDLQLVKIRNGTRNYISPSLAKHWPYGGHEIGDVSYKNAGYVARYTLKKQQALDKETGELAYGNRRPPYIKCSTRKGIGYQFFQRYKQDLFPGDECITPDGRKAPVPTYYRKLLLAEDPELAEELRLKRVEKAKANTDNTPERLAVRHLVKQKQAERLIREL